MIPPVLKIEGTFAGVDPVIVLVLTAAAAAVIVMTAIIARQLSRIQPKAAAPSKVEKASGEFDAWTERPKAQAEQDKEYYSLYGSMPGRPVGAASVRMPPPPPAPASSSPMGAPVVVDLSGRAPPRDDSWVSVGDETNVQASPPPLPIHPPALSQPTGPTDDVVAPTHGRRVRDTGTGEIPVRSTPPPSYERSSIEAGAVAPRAPPGDPYSPKAALPQPQAPPAPPAPARPTVDKLVAAKLAGALPEGTAVGAPARAAFRGPSRGQTVVGAGTAGTQEGTMLGPGKKSIRCPKCQTVFAGPATRPATVKCPACGTSGTLK
jgi:hypothetical protein